MIKFLNIINKGLINSMFLLRLRVNNDFSLKHLKDNL